jgi:hypothetical protein
MFPHTNLLSVQTESQAGMTSHPHLRDPNQLAGRRSARGPIAPASRLRSLMRWPPDGGKRSARRDNALHGVPTPSSRAIFQMP